MTDLLPSKMTPSTKLEATGTPTEEKGSIKSPSVELRRIQSQDDSTKDADDSSRATETASKGKWSKFRVLWLQLAMIILSLGLLAVVIIYVQATYVAQERSLEGLELSDLLKTDTNRGDTTDFSGPLNNTSVFTDADCDIFGRNDTFIGIRLCIKNNPTNSSAFMAGIFVCPKGIAKGARAKEHPSPNITTEVSFYSLQTSFVSSRLNFTITSVDDSTNPSAAIMVDLPAYRDALRWLLNYSDANLPPPSSIAQSFWSSQKLLSDPTTWGILSQNFQSILAYPFWIFNANNYGNVEVKQNEMISTLPSEYYTQASLVEPHVKLRIHPKMFTSFVALQALSLLFISGGVIWILKGPRQIQTASSFPLFDIIFRAEVMGDKLQGHAAANNDSSIIRGVKDIRVAVG